jgi:hypothetical protein
LRAVHDAASGLIADISGGLALLVSVYSLISTPRITSRYVAVSGMGGRSSVWKAASFAQL